MMFEKDQIIGRHYKLISKLGVGGMGQVYKAQDTNLGREVGIKFLIEEGSTSNELVQRFLNEGRILATINHRCVINVYASDVDEHLKVPFLVMEFVDGRSLDHYKKDFSTDLRNLLHHMIDLLEGIHACHQKGIIHRDLKPQNILINKEGQLKILDFGIAKTARKQTRTGVALGTPHYMSPEQCMGKADITGKADVYAIGIIFWEFLTGYLPFDLKTEADDPALAIALKHLNEPPPKEELKKVPYGERFTELLSAMLAKKPAERPEIPNIIESLKRELVKVSGLPETPSGQTGMVGDIYKIEKMIGEGGMGKVFKALDTSLNRVVAVKFLSEEASKDETIVERFIKEGQLLATVGHPNVLNIYASSRDRATKTPFLVMEYVDGVLLSDIKKNLSTDKKQIAPLMLQLFEGIKACHERGIIHRDLKPANLMVTRDGLLKIFDFGIAKTASSMTKTGMTVGTPQYMSPEQCTGDKDLSAKSDIYSMGIIFWELIYGEPPFVSNDKSNPELAIAMQHIQGTLPMRALSKDDPFLNIMPIIRKMLDKDPAKRPPLEEMIQALDDFIVEDTGEVSPETASQRRKIRSQRRSGIKEIIQQESEGPKKTTGWKFPAIAILLLAIGAGIFLLKPFSTGDVRETLVKSITDSVKRKDFDTAAKNLDALIQEKDGALLAQQFKFVISQEFERRAITAISSQDASGAIALLNKAVSIDAENASATQMLSKLLDEIKAREESARLISELTTGCDKLLANLTPGSGTTDLALKINQLDKLLAASEARRIETAWVEKFSREGEALIASDPNQALVFFEELKNRFKNPAMDSKIEKVKKAIEEKDSSMRKDKEVAGTMQSVEAELAKFSGESDPTHVISLIDRMVSLGQPGKAGGYRRQLAEKVMQAGDTLMASDKNKAILQYRKAGAIFPELPTLNDKIKAAEDAIQNEKVAAEKAMACETLQKKIDDGITSIKPPDSPAALLADLKTLEADFLKVDSAGTKRKALYDKFKSHADSIKDKDPLGAIESLKTCMLISPDKTGLSADISNLQAQAASQAATLATAKRLEEIRGAMKTLVKNPTAKASAKFPGLLAELMTLGQTAEAETFLDQALESIKGDIAKSKSIAETKTLYESAFKIIPKDSPKKVSLEKEMVATLEKKKGEMVTDIGKAVDSFKPSTNPKPLIARLKELKETGEAEKVKTFTQKIKTKFLAAVKPLEEKELDKASELLKALQQFDGMEKDEEIKTRLEALKEKALAQKPVTTEPPKATETTPILPPPGGQKKPEELIAELEKLTAPNNVEKSVPQILELVAALQKAGGTSQANGLKERAVASLIEIGDENAAQGSFDAAKAIYEKALKIVPNHPGVAKSIQALKAKQTPTEKPPVEKPVIDKPPVEKPSGFFVGGSGGLPSIQAALDQVPDGGTVKIRPGKYPGGVSISKKVTIEGEGSRDSIVVESSQGPVFTLSGGATISNMTIRYTGSEFVDAVKITGGSPVVKSCTVSSSASAKRPDWAACIAVYGGSPSISGNSVSQSKGMGIMVKGGSPRVSGNSVQGNKIYGIWVTDGASGSFEKNTVSGNDLSGIGIKGGASPSISGNTITNNGQNGIFIYEGGSGKIKGNTMTGNKWFGLQVASGGRPESVSDNNISGNQQGGVHVLDSGSRASLKGNTISGNSGAPTKTEKGGTLEQL